MRHRFLARATLPVALGALLALAGCAAGEPDGAAAAIAVIDDAGREVHLAAPARRIVSLVPATTEMVLALGAAERLVARTDYDRDPVLAALPSVGQGLTPNIEWLVTRRPDLVIAWPDGASRTVASRLRELGIAVYGARIETLDDIASTLRRIGVLLGRESAADSVVAGIGADLEAVRRAVAGRERPGVLYVVGVEPPFTAGPGSFIDELIAVAGGRNIFADAASAWSQVSLEEIVRRRPDLLVVPTGDVEGASPGRLAGLPGWGSLDAVRTGRNHAVDAEIFNRPGPRIGLVARRLARLIHPDAFPAEPTP